jgi:hypothetical protein
VSEDKQKIPSIDELILDNNIVINEVYVKAYYSPIYKLFLIIWDGVFSDQEYKNVFDQLLDFAKINKTIGVYSDVRRQGKVSPEAREYFKKHISPAGDALGMKRAAAIIDSSPFKLMYVNALIKISGQRAKVFSNPEKALAYLLEG